MTMSYDDDDDDDDEKEVGGDWFKDDDHIFAGDISPPLVYCMLLHLRLSVLS